MGAIPPNHIKGGLIMAYDIAMDVNTNDIILQDNGRTHGNKFITFVDRIEYIAIAGNLLFIAGDRNCFVRNQFL